ncbi:HAD hydrolase-like protein [Skermanella sp. TT6]|uniref:HAD hydrolase-like protein n=1 Tax=Skermanella cutis TaxID=2775420 RepID=A0ABX7B420_9PROT|nr:HAD hydrolase-like protein [Skermanella sp. TT6]QQP87885.1 HAD hydrolase-like protein [Skermanella sp. TT6]
MNHRLAIFDFDGTLADSLPWFRSVFGQVAERYRLRAPDAAEFEALRGLGNREILRHLEVPVWKLPLIARHMKGLMAADIERIPLFDGVPEMLRGLRIAGIGLAVVSSNSEANVRRVLGPDNAALIGHYGCGASIFGKGARFKAALRHGGVAPAQAICIGDEVRDADAARAQGIPFAAVAWGYATPAVLADQAPLVLFERVREIVPALVRRSGGPAG